MSEKLLNSNFAAKEIITFMICLVQFAYHKEKLSSLDVERPTKSKNLKPTRGCDLWCDCKDREAVVIVSVGRTF